MKILFVSQYFPPEPGAPAARVSELARAWAALGHDVTVLTGMPHHPTGVVPPEYRGALLRHERFGEAKVLRTWLYASANKGKVRRSASYASFGLSAALLGHWSVARPDLVVATSPQILCALAGRAIAALRRVPFVFEVRDLWPESIVAVGALAAGHPIVRKLEQVEEHLYRAASAIVVVTDSFRERLLERGIPAEKVHVVKNGVDLDRFHPAPKATALRARLGWEKLFVAAYAGTHGMAHGLDAVLDAARLLRDQPQIRLLFVGEGAERQRLEQRAWDEGLVNVRFLGALPREEMAEVYHSADALIVPLRRAELFKTVIPSKIFEILACERPVLLSVEGEAQRLVEASGGGISLPPEDPAALAKAIIELEQDPQRAAELGREGRAFVQRHFDRKTLARRYLGILARVR